MSNVIQLSQPAKQQQPTETPAVDYIHNAISIAVVIGNKFFGRCSTITLAINLAANDIRDLLVKMARPTVYECFKPDMRRQMLLLSQQITAIWHAILNDGDQNALLTHFNALIDCRDYASLTLTRALLAEGRTLVANFKVA